MRSLRSVIVAATLILAASSAKASILFEPYAGYSSESLALELASNIGTINYTMSGLDYGARLGYAGHMFFIAADYNATTSMTSTLADPPAGATGYSADPFTRSDIFGVVGIKIPMLQIYAGYGFATSLTQKQTSSDVKFTGTSIKAGLGYTGLPFVAINVEYLMNTYKKYESGGTSYDVGDTANGSLYSKASGSAIMVNLSVPLHWH